jgi:hypothetical protein
MWPYRFQLLLVLSDNDHEAHSTFYEVFPGMISDENLMSKVVFSDEVTIHASGKVNTYNCCSWALQNPRASVKLQ